MKICDLTQFYSPVSGGVKRYLAEKVRYLRTHVPNGEHVLIVPGEKTEVIEKDRQRIYRIRSPLVSRASRYRLLLNLHAVEGILERERPDLIECGDPYQLAWKALASGWALGIPVVGFYHSHFPEAYVRTAAKYLGSTATQIMMEISHRYVRNLYGQFARTFVPSAMLGALLREWGVDNTVTIDLGVDPEVFHPNVNGAAPNGHPAGAPGARPGDADNGGDGDDDGSDHAATGSSPGSGAALRRELGLDDHTRLLLYVGRLAAEKNTHTLFAAFDLLRRQRALDGGRERVVGNGHRNGRNGHGHGGSEHNGRNGHGGGAGGADPGDVDYHLLVIGDGQQRRQLQTLQKQHPAAVTWRSYCGDPHDLAQLYRSADLFVHPGVQETFGLVTLESQACGTPVVGIRGSYMDRIVLGDLLGQWAAENTPASLADAIARLSRRSDLRQLGARTSLSVRRRYAWTQVFERLFRSYREVLAEHHRRRRGD